MELINAIFGDSINNIDSFKQLIKQEKFNHEYQDIEYKEIKFNVEQKNLNSHDEDNIICELVGYLNSFESQGILILGVNDKTKEVKSIPEIIINKPRLSDKITSFIKTIPLQNNIFRLDIVPINCGENSYIYVIQITRKEDNCVFFYNGTAYIREDHKCKRLNVNQTIDLINKKNVAKVFIGFKNLSLDGNTLSFSLFYTNKGALLGKYIHSNIFIISDNSNLKVVQEKNSLVDTTELNPKPSGGFIKTYQITAGYPPTSNFIYPLQNSHFEKIKIKNIDPVSTQIMFGIQSYEERGITKQEIHIIIKDKDVTLKEIFSQYYNYFTVG